METQQLQGVQTDKWNPRRLFYRYYVFRDWNKGAITSFLFMYFITILYLIYPSYVIELSKQLEYKLCRVFIAIILLKWKTFIKIYSSKRNQ